MIISSIDLFFRRDCGVGVGPAVELPRAAAALPFVLLAPGAADEDSVLASVAAAVVVPDDVTGFVVPIVLPNMGTGEGPDVPVVEGAVEGAVAEV